MSAKRKETLHNDLGTIKRHSIVLDKYPSIGNEHHLSPQLTSVSDYMGYQSKQKQNIQGHDIDLRWQNLKGGNFKYAKMNKALLWGCCLANTDFQGADLQEADLTGADLMGANLKEACLTNTCLVGARYDKMTIFPEDFGSPESHGMVFHDEHLATDFIQ